MAPNGMFVIQLLCGDYVLICVLIRVLLLHIAQIAFLIVCRMNGDGGGDVLHRN